MHLPLPWEWHEEDTWLLGSHWSYDLGAAEISRKLAQGMDCGAVLANFSRLLVDANRELDSSTLFRKEAEGRTIRLNADVDAAEVEGKRR